MAASVAASFLPPVVAGVAIDVIGWWFVQLVTHVNVGGFLLLPLECEKCDVDHFF
jgi:hypothetical protein